MRLQSEWCTGEVTSFRDCLSLTRQGQVHRVQVNDHLEKGGGIHVVPTWIVYHTVRLFGSWLDKTKEHTCSVPANASPPKTRERGGGFSTFVRLTNLVASFSPTARASAAFAARCVDRDRRRRRLHNTTAELRSGRGIPTTCSIRY